MDLEHLIKLPYREFSQWENGGELHQAEYEVYQIPGSDMVIMKKVPGSDIIINTNGVEIPEGYKNSFREER